MPKSSPRGTYLIIADALRLKIEEGSITTSLPSEASLAASHNVSRNTVRRALKALAASGLVDSEPGSGWRVVKEGARPPLVRRMTDLITDESLAVGDTFPSEAKLCERFGVSRTAVRRALAQMEGGGLVATVHGKGRTVRALPTSPEHP
ncbi:winged helix-turn-helix domain-containing protein [Streptomyces sp. NPDC058052]|uniref:winged helix-turn-helix domain-containing protein n=1 Tax=Streptomyces sp. NPDC058052 TaxID=3346316 RepID=UPI0036E1930B